MPWLSPCLNARNPKPAQSCPSFQRARKQKRRCGCFCAGLATIPLATMLAADRYRSLGHALVGGFLVTRAGSFERRRDVLECDGIIGWNLRQSFFQRRSGLVTLTATTAAGRQRYAVTDVPLPMAVSLGNRAVPGLLTDFLGQT